MQRGRATSDLLPDPAFQPSVERVAVAHHHEQRHMWLAGLIRTTLLDREQLAHLRDVP